MEIERKYLVKKPPDHYRDFPFHEIEQGYLCTDPVVRIRREDDEYYLTYKGKGLMVREEYNQRQAATEHENRVVDKVVENAEMEIPEPMLRAQTERIFEDSARRMQSQGISLEQYFQYTGMTREQMMDQMRPQALKRIQTRLVLEAVVEAESIKVEDTAVEKELEKMAEAYKMELEELKSHMGDAEMAQIKEDLAVQEAVDFLVAEANLI